MSPKCPHKGCNCLVEREGEFCSTYCEGQGEITDIVCGCGHNGCAEVIPSDEQTMEPDYAR